MSRSLLINPIAPLQPVPSDIEISQSITPFHIAEVAKAAGILESEFEPYGRFKGKVWFPLSSVEYWVDFLMLLPTNSRLVWTFEKD